MEQQKKIELYVQRPFGDKVNATFDFLKENWKTLFKLITFILLPLSLVQAIGVNKVSSLVYDLSSLQESGGDISSVFNVSVIMHYILMMFCVFVGSSLLTSIVYSSIKTYGTREGRLSGITLGEIQPMLLTNAGKTMLVSLFMILVFIVLTLVLGMFTALSPWTLLLTIPAFFASLVPLALFTPIYLFEDISLWNAFIKAFRIGFPTWGGTLIIVLVMGIIAGVLQFVTNLPYQVAGMVKYFFTLSDMGSETTVSAGYSFFLYVLAVLQSFGGYVGTTFVLLGIAYQYGHASEVVDSVSVTNDIEHFDTL